MIICRIKPEAYQVLLKRLPREAILSTTHRVDGLISIGLRNDYFFRIDKLMLPNELISDAIIRTQAGTIPNGLITEETQP